MVLWHAEIVFYSNIPCIILDVIIYVGFCIKMYIYDHPQSRKLPLFQQIFHNICFSTLLLASISDMLHGLGAMLSNTDLLSHKLLSVEIIHVSADVFYYVSSLSLYIILIHRLYSTFSDSAYQASKWFYYWVSLQIFSQIILMIIYIIILIRNDCQTKRGCNKMGWTASLITANDYILNIVCVTLFVIKLRQLVFTKLNTEVIVIMSQNSRSKQKRQQSVDTCVNGVIEDSKIDTLLTVITKQTVIGIFVTLTNQAFVTCIFIRLMFEHEDLEKVDITVMIAYVLRGVEGVFICFLLYIGLQINEKEYNVSCRYCHKTCYDLCLCLTAKTVKQSVKQSMVDNDYVVMSDMGIE